jgi:hypothetical protein
MPDLAAWRNPDSFPNTIKSRFFGTMRLRLLNLTDNRIDKMENQIGIRNGASPSRQLS